MSKAHNRVTLGLAVTAISLASMLVTQSISYKGLEAQLVETTASADYLALELEKADNLVISASEDLEQKQELIELMTPAVELATSTSKECLESMRGGYCSVVLYNVAGKGLVTGSQL